MSIIALLLFSCNNKLPEQKNSYQEDSTAIATLIRNTYTWYDEQVKGRAWSDFTYLHKDSIITSIDKHFLNNNIERLKALSFFSDDFINQYRQIHFVVDSLVKKSKTIWLINELPPGHGGDYWCNCQDGGSFSTIKIKDISLTDTTAIVHWMWSEPDFADTTYYKPYKVQLKKINNAWKISYLKGFDASELNAKYF